MGLLHFSSLEKLVIHSLHREENFQLTNRVLGKTWLMQPSLKKGQQQYWHVFHSGPAFKHLLHSEYTHMHVLILKWGFFRLEHAKCLFLACSIALVMLVNSQPYAPDGHNRKFIFPKPRNFSVVQTVAESSVFRTIRFWFA